MDQIPTALQQVGDDFVDGHDFYGPDPDAQDGRYRDEGDDVSRAVGSPGYMTAYVVGECVQQLGDSEVATLDPEHFDRYYFPPDVDPEASLAPVLIDIIGASTMEERQREREAKHVVFKAAWCAERKVRYCVLVEDEDLLGSSIDAIRQKILGEQPKATVAEPVAAVETPDVPVRGVQHPRGD